MPKAKLRPPREAARILGISFATVKQWIYKGKLRSVKTLGGHHRILEEDIARHLRSKIADETRKNVGWDRTRSAKATNYRDASWRPRSMV